MLNCAIDFFLNEILITLCYSELIAISSHLAGRENKTKPGSAKAFLEWGTEAHCQQQLWTPSPGTGSTARGVRGLEFSTDGSSSLMRSPLRAVGGPTLLVGDSEMHAAIIALCF